MQKLQRIAIGGSAANPSHLGHLVLLKALMESKKFEKVLWILSGIRSDKKDLVAPEHRAKMTELTLTGSLLGNEKTKFIVVLDDVYGNNRPTIEWIERLEKLCPRNEIIWYTGADSVIPNGKKFGCRGDGSEKCELETWHRGNELMQKHKFLIIPRVGYTHPGKLILPPQFEILDVELPADIASSKIRRLVMDGNKEFEKMVTPKVAKYIGEHKLYERKGGRP